MFKKLFQNKQGFSLLETLLAITILSVIIGLSLPVYHAFQSKNNLEVAVNIVAGSLHRAVALSRAVKEDDVWGVRIDSGYVTIFKGNNYATRDANFDEVNDIASNLAVLGLQEIYFSKLTGLPSATGLIILTSTDIDETRSVDINTKSTISF